MSQEIMDAQEFSDDLFFNLQLDLLGVFNMQGYFTKLNKSWENALGYSIDEICKISLFELLHPEDLRNTLKGVSNLDTGDAVKRFTNRYRHKNGSYRYIEWASRQIDDMIYSCAKDVTDMHFKKQELFRDQKRLNAIINSSSNYIACLNEDFTFTYTNKKFDEEFNFLMHNDPNIPNTFLDTIAKDVEKFKNELILSYKEYRKITYQTELLHRTSSNKDLYILWQFTCTSDNAGNIIEIQCWGVNITERKHNLLKIAEDKAQEFLDMSTPITELWDGILLLPLVGMVNAHRAQNLMSAVLDKISSAQAKVFIIDISGVPVVDTAVANHFIKLSAAIKLMGCMCTMSGITPAVAQTIIELGIQIDEIHTTGTMKAALEKALSSTGLKLVTLK